jgi:hypothetical protein
MEDPIEKEIMERMKAPGWVTTRGVLLDPLGDKDNVEHQRIEEVMKRLKEEGRVVLWRLTVDRDGSVLLAASRPDYPLDEELRTRGAWAKAEKV